jgi:AcrR family transcriptional regulator
MTSPPMSGRRAQAARNDHVILESARAVFTANPEAPIAAVAEHAGVGISALYRRYGSKEELLRKLCADGLARYTEVAERAVRDDGDPWEVFARFMHDMVDSKTSSLVRHLAGLFTPTEELYRASAHGGELNVRIFTRAQDAGVLRPDITVNDMTLAFELVDGVTVRDEERTIQLRHRYMTVLLDGMRPTATTELPGPPPQDGELSERWEPKNG